MAKRLIIWTETAENQLENIFEYWNNKTGNKRYSNKINGQLSKALKIIVKYPESFKFVFYLQNRECVLGDYSIFYKYFNNTILVTAFWDNRQDPQKLYELLKK